MSAVISAIFFDIGGVILTNGWDVDARRRAAAHFHLDWDDFERKHQAHVDAFETGRMGLDEYMAQVVFAQARPFSPDDFRQFLFSQSRELLESRALVDRLAQSRQTFIAALNNEGREVNAYRIKEFKLSKTFAAFFSSCYVGIRKPAPAIYRLAAEVMQRNPAECIFVDDRAENIAGAQKAGLMTIQFPGVPQLTSALANLGIECAPHAARGKS